MRKYFIFIILLVLVSLVAWYLRTGGFLGGTQSGNEMEARERMQELFVYETDANSPQECSVYEEFDPENRVCFFECENEEECQNILSSIDEEFGQWADELGKEDRKIAEKAIPINDNNLRGEYNVTAGENIFLEKGTDNDEYRKIWEEIAQLSPNSLSDKYIETYQVFEDKRDDVLAFVDDEDMNGKWRIAVNIAGYKASTQRENKATIIHELAHIISLNTSQVDSNIEENRCPTFYLEEGCTNVDSYLNNFVKLFWTGVKKDREGGQEFTENKFVSEYASSNEVEDLAESFAFFILEKQGLENTVIKNQKINFFYQYPELVQIRNEMRNVLAKDIVRERKTQ